MTKTGKSAMNNQAPRETPEEGAVFLVWVGGGGGPRTLPELIRIFSTYEKAEAYIQAHYGGDRLESIGDAEGCWLYNGWIQIWSFRVDM